MRARARARVKRSSATGGGIRRGSRREGTRPRRKQCPLAGFRIIMFEEKSFARAICRASRVNNDVHRQVCAHVGFTGALNPAGTLSRGNSCYAKLAAITASRSRFLGSPWKGPRRDETRPHRKCMGSHDRVTCVKSENVTSVRGRGRYRRLCTRSLWIRLDIDRTCMEINSKSCNGSPTRSNELPTRFYFSDVASTNIRAGSMKRSNHSDDFEIFHTRPRPGGACTSISLSRSLANLNGLSGIRMNAPA